MLALDRWQMIKVVKTGVGGWPLVPSAHFPGEMTLACPRCKSTNITMTIRPGVRGSGSHGRWRIGDYGGHDLNVCNTCGHTSDGLPAPRWKR